MENPMAEITRKMMEPVTALQQINERALRETNQRQMETLDGIIGMGTKQAKGLSDAKNVQDVVSAQAELVADLSSMALKNAKWSMERITQGQDELAALMEKSVNRMMERS